MDIPGPVIKRLSAPWSIRIADPGGTDLATVHGWMQHPHVVEFWHQDWPADRWQAEWEQQLGDNHSLPCLVGYEGKDIAYVEIYRVLRDRISACYDYDPNDLGVHLAIGEQSRTGQGLGRRLLRELATALLVADPDCRRVIAEPDVRNWPSVKAFTAAGFRTCGTVELSDKTAVLCAYPRDEKDIP